MILSLLAGCSKEPEYGTVEDIDVSEITEDPAEKDIFSDYDVPYYYNEGYDEVFFKKANMKFAVPSTWRVTVHNSRYISLLSPSDDPFLPGTTVNILASYGTDIEPNDMSNVTHNDNSMYFSNYFREELPGLTFNLYGNGIQGNLRKYYGEDAIHNGLDFAGGEGSTLATTLEVDSVVMIGENSKYYTDEYSMVATYVNWDHSPFCFAAVVPIGYNIEGRAMLEFMASTIEYVNYDSERCNRVSYEDFSMDVPNSFAAVNNSENIFVSDLNSNSDTAGMVIGVVRLDGTASKKVDADLITEHVANPIFTSAYGRYKGKKSYRFDTQADTGDAERNYSGNIFMTQNSNDKRDISGNAFGVSDIYYIDYYTLEKEDMTYIIAVSYSKRQEALARVIGHRAYSSFEVEER